MAPKRSEAFRFFLENAGYATPPGRAACALNLMRAEREAHERGWVVLWQAESEDCGCEDGPHESEFAALYHPSQLDSIGEPKRRQAPLASVGAVCGADRNYRRVIEAELAAEVLSHIASIER